MQNTTRREFINLSTSAGVAAGATLWMPALVRAKQQEQKRIKVGQIGTAHGHAPGKMGALRKLKEDYEVVGIVESDAALRKQVERAPAYQGLPWMSEAELLNTPGLKAVAVETDVPDLVPTAQRCVEAGMHLHLDKPAGTSLDAFRRLLDEARRRRLTVQMGYMLRYNPALQFAKRAIEQGWLGNVFEIDSVMSKMVDSAARKKLARFSGGSMFELGCHLIDTTIMLMGPPRQVTPFLSRTRSPQDTLADNTLAILEYPKATATVRSAVIEVAGQRRRQFVICGDEGTLEIRPLEPGKTVQLTLAQARGPYKKGAQSVALRSVSGRYDDELRDLAKIIRGEKEDEFGPEHDLAVHKAVLMASGMP
ncbi:MAG: Gfo/Idh/MocA family oxidoreductase [Pirellulales bacterium]|nr:Gfo/Idh/MocA family oxidoreductase [Pirellulales bacterium]